MKHMHEERTVPLGMGKKSFLHTNQALGCLIAAAAAVYNHAWSMAFTHPHAHGPPLLDHFPTPLPTSLSTSLGKRHRHGGSVPLCLLFPAPLSA